MLRTLRVYYTLRIYSFVVVVAVLGLDLRVYALSPEPLHQPLSVTGFFKIGS
jgi:hypothetical protein